MGKQLDIYGRITSACQKPDRGNVGIRAITNCPPLMGLDDNRIMPPTYTIDEKGKTHPIHHYEDRFKDGDWKRHVIIDSPQSCANRMEIALLRWSKNDKKNVIPNVIVRFNEIKEERSVLEFGHRIYSAFIRDSLLDGNKFPSTELGQRLYGNDLRVAMRSVAMVNPIGIACGVWCTTVRNSHVLLKFGRVVTNQIVATTSDTRESCKRSGSLICPFNTRSKDVDVFEDRQSLDREWSFDKGEGKNWKKVEKGAAGLNHSSIPPTLEPLGASVSDVIDQFVLSFHGLSRYATGRPKEDTQVRTMVACTALLSHTLKFNDMYLRSGCELSPEETVYEFIGGNSEKFSLSCDDAAELYHRAWKDLSSKDFKQNYLLTLDANTNVEKLIKGSRENLKDKE